MTAAADPASAVAIREHWLEPITRVRSGWQPRRDAPAVPLFRAGDRGVLLEYPAIDWAAVRVKPAESRRRSPG